MLIDLECPIELTGFELLHDDRANARVYVHLNNLSERTVTGFHAILRWIDRGSGQSGELNYETDSMNVAPRGRFTVSFSVSNARGADDIEMAFTKITFTAGEDWLGDLDRVVDIPAYISPGRDLNALIAVAGGDAVCFPAMSERWWQCVCGRANPIARAACVRCRRGKDEVLTGLTRDKVLSGEAPWLPDTLRSEIPEIEMPFNLDIPEHPEPEPEEPPSPPSPADRQKFLRQRNLLIRRTVTLLVAAIVIVLVAVLWSILSESKERVGEVIPPTPIETVDPSKPI